MRIRSVTSAQDIKKAHEIESTVYTKESAATLEAFQMRMNVFGSYFLVAETEQDVASQLIWRKEYHRQWR
jgi:hypothetical protein